jgi:hypothetical protein
VRERLLRVLLGAVLLVVWGLRERGTKHGLTGAKQKMLAQVCNCLEKILERMKYDEYLAEGYPIASGGIEGACRHPLKDRLERAGMHWIAGGTQALWDLPSTYGTGIGRSIKRIASNAKPAACICILTSSRERTASWLFERATGYAQNNEC